MLLPSKLLASLALLALLAIPARAEEDPTAFAWQQHPGAQVPLAAQLRDEAGHDIRLYRIFGQTPVILDLGYYHCPTLCGVVRSDLLGALQTSGLRAGRDYRLVSISIDPAETAADAAQAKTSDLAMFSSTGATGIEAAGWHYLTGSTDAVAAIAGTVGFRDRYDARFKQFMHPAGIVVLTPNGTVSSYLLGVGYTGGDMRAAILRASQGGIARASLPILLLCFHYDPATGRYTLAIQKILRLMAGFTVVGISGLVIVLLRRSSRRTI